MAVTILRQIPISDQTISRLKALSEPLDDTYDSVIRRLLDAYEENSAGKGRPTSAVPSAAPVRDFDPFAPPGLTHTKVTYANLDGEELTNPNWNKLLDRALTIAMRRANSFVSVQRISTVNLNEGTKSDEGYHYIPEAGFSVQGQDANDAWRGIAHICRTLGLGAEVHFLWRVKEGATFPGSQGTFTIARRG